mgnify:FL=1
MVDSSQNNSQGQECRLVDVYEDVGVSGATKPLDRPGFQKIVETLKSGKADGLIVAALDRIARSLMKFSETYRLFSENKSSHRCR